MAEPPTGNSNNATPASSSPVNGRMAVRTSLSRSQMSTPQLRAWSSEALRLSIRARVLRSLGGWRPSGSSKRGPPWRLGRDLDESPPIEIYTTGVYKNPVIRRSDGYRPNAGRVVGADGSEKLSRSGKTNPCAPEFPARRRRSGPSASREPHPQATQGVAAAARLRGNLGFHAARH